MSDYQSPASTSGSFNNDSTTFTVVVLAAIGVGLQFVLPIWSTEADPAWGIRSESLDRADVQVLLNWAGESQVPLWAGVAGLSVAALLTLFVPRVNSWRGPVAGIAALITLYLPVGLATTGGGTLSVALDLMHPGLWVVSAITVIVSLLCILTVRE